MTPESTVSKFSIATSPKSTFRRSVAALALGAAALVTPIGEADAQPHRRRNHGRRGQSTEVVASVNQNCDLLSGTHTTAEWMRNANDLGQCVMDLSTQVRALRDEQRRVLESRMLEKYADAITAYAHALTDASDVSGETITVSHNIPLHLTLTVSVDIPVWQRFGERMLTAGTMILTRARQPGLSPQQTQQLLVAGMECHWRATKAFNRALGDITYPANARFQNLRPALENGLREAQQHTVAEWMSYANASIEKSRNNNNAITSTPVGGGPISNPTTEQRNRASSAAEYYLRALEAYCIAAIGASDRTNVPEIGSLNMTYEPRVSYGAADWYPIFQRLNDIEQRLQTTMVTGAPRNRATLERSFFEFTLRSIEVLLHSLNDASDSRTMGSETIATLEYNVRRLVLIWLQLQLPDLPQAMPPNATAEVIRDVQTALIRNNTLRRRNLEIIANLERLSLADMSRVRVVLINWLRLLDRTLTDQLNTIRASLDPARHQGLRICEPNSALHGDAARILRNFLCQTPRPIAFVDFVTIATDSQLVDSLPPTLRPADGVNLNVLGLVDDQQRPLTTRASLGKVYETDYARHLAFLALGRVDTRLATTTNTPSLLGTIRLSNDDPSSSISAALGELTTEHPVVSQERVPEVVPEQRDPSHVPVHVVVPGPARYVRVTHMNPWRVVGMVAAGAGIVTAGVALGFNIDTYNHAQGIPNSPEVAAMRREVEAIRVAQYPDQAAVDVARARLRAIDSQYRALYEPDAEQSRVTLGIVIAGGVVAIAGGLVAAFARDRVERVLVPESVPSVTGSTQGPTPHPRIPAGQRSEAEQPGLPFSAGLTVNQTTLGVNLGGRF